MRNAHVAEPFRSILNDIEDGTARMAREWAEAGREARLDVGHYMATARLFRTADDLLDAIAGPAQRDAHVQAYHLEQRFRAFEDTRQARQAAVAAEVDKIIAERRRA